MRGNRETILARLARWRFRRRLAAALALNRRGELRPDGLPLVEFHNQLRIAWRARDVHPCDRDRPQNQVNRLFVEQCLKDTNKAIERLFLRLPEIEFIEFKVIDHRSSATILSGSVRRDEVQEVRGLSPGMKLKTFGATYRLNNSSFEPLT